jgi:outer membrane protein OmpA-like peptidoglycan-associated protein
MRHQHLTTCLTLILPIVCGCSSPPMPRRPDGGNRAPVNSSESIEHYQLRQDDATPAQRPTPTQQRIMLLEQQVEALRRQLATQQLRGTSASAPSTPSTALAVIDDVEVDVLPNRMVLRFPQASGQASFAPSPAVSALLHKAAALATRIEVRGRTDAGRADARNRRLAAARAARARQFLLDNGVAPSKLRASFLAAGGFIADNRTDAGRARNRRVEIELIGLEQPPLVIAPSIRSTP